MPAINPLPTPPSRNDPANFSDRADAFLAALPAYTSEANALLDDVHTSRDTVQGLRNEVIAAGLENAAANAATATTKAAEAASSASEAFGYLQAYRATSYGALAADPVADPNGNPPTVGDEYFNTSMNLLKRFNGVTWQASDIATADLAATGGSALVGADDGASGSLWTTVAGFITKVISSAGSSVVGFIQSGAGVVKRTLQDKGREVVSPLDYMTQAQRNDVTSGAGLVDVTAAINTASATGKSLKWPDGVYRIEGTITGGAGGWFGNGQGDSAYGSDWDGSGTFLKIIGANGGAAHIKPPRDWVGFHVDGVDKTPLAVDLGQDGSFTAFQRWKRITIRRCADALREFNFYSTSLEDVVIQGNVRGVTITPTDGAVDDGYFTATSWNNVHIADNDLYGLNAAPPLVSGTWGWDNVVIERNGTVGGTYQARLKNVSLTGRGIYLEGSSTVPALSLDNAALTGDEWFVNGTGGIDANNQAATLNIRRLRMVGVTDVLSNFPSTARLTFTDSDLRTDVRGWASLFSLQNVTINGVTDRQNFRARLLSIGQSPSSTYQPTEFRLGLSGKKTYTGTINANSGVNIVGDQYFPGIMSDAAGFGSVQGYYPGLLVQITPATTGGTDYYCVRLINTTAANITLTAVQINWTILRANPQAL